MAYEWEMHSEQISKALAESIRRGLAVPREQFIDALERVAACRRLLDEVFAEVDVLLTPTAQGEAPLGLSFTGDHKFQSIWTQLHVPTITLPTHVGPNAMPIGIQLVAPRYADNRLLAIAQLIFQILGRGPLVET